MSPKRRRLLGAGALVAAGLAVLAAVGAVLAVLNARTSSSPVGASSGSVTLTKSQSLSCPITASPAGDPVHIRPGDSGSCTFAYTYSGLPAWVAVDIVGTSTSAPSGTSAPTPYGAASAPAAVGLFAGPTPLQLRVGSSTGTPLTPSSSGSLANVLLSSPTAPTTSGNGSVTVYWSLPTSAGNAYQAAGGSLTLTVHAVQAANNPMVGGVPGSTGTLSCTSFTACGSSAGFSWS